MVGHLLGEKADLEERLASFEAQAAVAAVSARRSSLEQRRTSLETQSDQGVVGASSPPGSRPHSSAASPAMRPASAGLPLKPLSEGTGRVPPPPAVAEGEEWPYPSPVDPPPDSADPSQPAP